MTFQMSRNFDEENNLIILKPSGDLDINNSSDFKNIALKEYEKYKTDILIDGESLNYLDSTGLGALISLLNETKDDQKKIYIENMKKSIRKLFTITKLDNMFIFRGE